LLLCLGWLSSAGAQQAPGAPAAAGQDLVLRGDAVCTRCHNEKEESPVLKIGRRKHGTVADARTPTCTSCHGESAEHARRPRAKVDIVFRKDSPNAMDDRDAPCVGCHRGRERMFWIGSAHQTRGTGCTSCHDVHADRDPARNKATQAEVCFACHKEQRIQITRPSRHLVLEGKVACSDCHNPHGSAGPKLLVRDTVNDTCFQCHMEKRGPFLWNHQPVTEDCGLCHNPHGTTVASLLKWRSPFLCEQCHEAQGHRGGIPGFTSTTSGSGGVTARQITMGRGCVNCHTNIHGSNNPMNSSNSQTFRR
jgi:DmsE family decaheme c-type cytochrome